MSLRAALAVLSLTSLAGVSSASGQQPPTCFEERAIIVGTANPDTLTGTPGKDVIDVSRGTTRSTAAVATISSAAATATTPCSETTATTR